MSVATSLWRNFHVKALLPRHRPAELPLTRPQQSVQSVSTMCNPCLQCAICVYMPPPPMCNPCLQMQYFVPLTCADPFYRCSIVQWATGVWSTACLSIFFHFTLYSGHLSIFSAFNVRWVCVCLYSMLSCPPHCLKVCKVSPHCCQCEQRSLNRQRALLLKTLCRPATS